MSDTTASSFVRQELVPERPAPVKTTGLIGFLRTRLFNSPTNILITIVCALLLWFIVVPALRFTLFDAVWTGKDRTACLAENAGHPVGACWPFIKAKLPQLMYGFYPEPERWRVDLTYALGAILLIPLLIPRLPYKGANAVLFFGLFPLVGFFLLTRNINNQRRGMRHLVFWVRLNQRRRHLAAIDAFHVLPLDA